MPPEPRAVAGVASWLQPPGDGELERLRRALSGERTPASARRLGALAVGWTGAEPATDGDRVCLLSGRLYAAAPGAGGDPDLAACEAGLLARWPAGTWTPPRSLRGDAGIVLWDAGRGRGVLACDQMGGRSLYWHRGGDRVTFASELPVLLDLLAARPGPDPGVLAHWLAVSGRPADRTMYDGVRRLAGGHALALGDGVTAPPERWWDPTAAGDLLEADPDELAALLRERLTVAVARRTPGAELTALQLSGGLDSSAVAGVAGTLAGELRPRRAYSAVFPDHPTTDETEFLDPVVRELGLSSTRAVVRAGSVISGSLDYLERWRIPPVSPNLFFWLPLLERAAADGVRVMLDGEGGDELFGLSPYLIADRLRAGRVRAAMGLAAGIHKSPPSRAAMAYYLRRFGVGGLAPPWLRTVRARLRRGPHNHVPPWMGVEQDRAFAALADDDAWKRRPGPRWRRWLTEAVCAGVGQSMAYEHVGQRAAMAGIEARHPLVDVDVVELMFRVPPELAFQGPLSRPLLRGAVAGLVPDVVRLRPDKRSFDAIFQQAIAGPDLPIARRLLGDDAELGAHVDLGAMRAAVLDRVPADGPDRQHWTIQMWRLVTAECWLRSQSDAGAPRKIAEAVGRNVPTAQVELARVQP